MHPYIYARMSSTHTPLIVIAMTDYKSIVLSMSINPYLPVEMIETIASYIETPSREALHKHVHGLSCDWCARYGYHAKCPGQGESGDLLAKEMFAADNIKHADWLWRFDLGYIVEGDGEYDGMGYEPDHYEGPIYMGDEIMYEDGEDDDEY